MPFPSRSSPPAPCLTDPAESAAACELSTSETKAKSSAVRAVLEHHPKTMSEHPRFTPLKGRVGGDGETRMDVRPACAEVSCLLGCSPLSQRSQRFAASPAAEFHASEDLTPVCPTERLVSARETGSPRARLLPGTLSGLPSPPACILRPELGDRGTAGDGRAVCEPRSRGLA